MLRREKDKMAIRWQWAEKAGEITFTQHGNEFTCSWYEGNALMIVLDEHPDDTYNLVWFFADFDHAKNCLGQGKDKETSFTDMSFTHLTIHRKFFRQDWGKLAKMWAKAYPDITITIEP